jgi:hypothetical protein
MEPLPSGSHLVLSHGTSDNLDPKQADRAADFYRSNVTDGQARSHEGVLALFDGLDLIEPGLVPVHRWRPDGKGPSIPDHQALIYVGVARKP